jgi:hypothetical protein
MMLPCAANVIYTIKPTLFTLLLSTPFPSI